MLKNQQSFVKFPSKLAAQILCEEEDFEDPGLNFDDFATKTKLHISVPEQTLEEKSERAKSERAKPVSGRTKASDQKTSAKTGRDAIQGKNEYQLTQSLVKQIYKWTKQMVKIDQQVKLYEVQHMKNAKVVQEIWKMQQKIIK